MGIIQRQSIKKSVVNYLGVGIGAISTLFIYPHSLDEYGLLQFMVATAALIVPFANLGGNMTVVRFFPDFKNEQNGHNGYLSFLLLSTLLGFLVITALLLFFQNSIYQFYSDKDPLLLQYLPYVIPLTYLMANIIILVHYTSNFHRVVVPSIFHELLLKIALPTLILLFLAGLLSTEALVKSYLVIHLIILLLLFAYLHYLGELKLKLNFQFLTRPMAKKLSSYAIFAILGSLSSILAFRIDIFMVGNFLGTKMVGVYGIALFIANSIEVPQRAIISITSPFVSQAMSDKNYEEVRQLYQKVSINLSIVGIALFLLVYFNFDDLFSLIPKGEKILPAKYVVLFLGLAKLTDMITSVNGQIIGFSSRYRFNLYAVVFLGLMNILLNIYLIPKYQIIGAAMATAISIILYNLLKLAYVYLKFGIHPFTRNTVQLLVLSIITTFALLLVPATDYLLLNIFIRTVVVGLLFAVGIFYFNIAPDLIDIAKKTWARLQINK